MIDAAKLLQEIAAHQARLALMSQNARTKALTRENCFDTQKKFAYPVAPTPT